VQSTILLIVPPLQRLSVCERARENHSDRFRKQLLLDLGTYNVLNSESFSAVWLPSEQGGVPVWRGFLPWFMGLFQIARGASKHGLTGWNKRLQSTCKVHQSTPKVPQGEPKVPQMQQFEVSRQLEL